MEIQGADFERLFAAVMDRVAERLVPVVTDRVIEHLRRNPLQSPSNFFNMDQAAAYVNITSRALRSRHERGTGPKATYVGRLVRFHRDDLDAWANAPKLQR